jgi:hypothetical protein
MVQGIGRVNPLDFNGMGEWGCVDGMKRVIMMD